MGNGAGRFIKSKIKDVLAVVSKHPWKTTLIVLIICLSFFLKMYEIPKGVQDEFPGSDAYSYDQNAMSFLHGQSAISPYFNPLETMYLIVTYGIFGHNIFMAKFIQILLSFLIPFFLYHVTKKFFGWQAGYIAAILALIHPSIIYYSAHLWSEFWIIFLLSALLYVYVRMIDRGKDEENGNGKKREKEERKRYWQYALIGILSGIAALGKIWVLVLGGILVLFLLIKDYGKNLWLFIRKSLIFGGLFLLGVLVIVVPWSMYASHTAGYFVPVNTNSPTNLYIGNNPEGEIAYTSKPYNWNYMNDTYLKEGRCGDLLGSSNGTLYDKYFKTCAGKYASNYIVTHPGKFISKMAKFTFNYWLFPNLEFYQRYIRSPGTLKTMLWIFWVLGVIGILASLLRFKEFIPFYLMILAACIINGLAFYLARYKAGLAPLAVFFAAGGLYTIWYLIFSSKKKDSREEDGESKESQRKQKRKPKRAYAQQESVASKKESLDRKKAKKEKVEKTLKKEESKEEEKQDSKEQESEEQDALDLDAEQEVLPEARLSDERETGSESTQSEEESTAEKKLNQ